MQSIIEVPISKIKQHPDNPRQITTERLAALVESIKTFPEMLTVRPLLLNKEYLILAGNAKYLAAKQIGRESLPCIVVNFDEEKQKELMLKDNSHHGEWDYKLLLDKFDIGLVMNWLPDMPDLGVSLPSESLPDDPEMDEKIKRMRQNVTKAVILEYSEKEYGQVQVLLDYCKNKKINTAKLFVKAMQKERDSRKN